MHTLTLPQLELSIQLCLNCTWDNDARRNHEEAERERVYREEFWRDVAEDAALERSLALQLIDTFERDLAGARSEEE